MKRVIQYFVTAGLILSLVACSKNAAEPNNKVATQAQSSEPASPAPTEVVNEPTIPTGTRLHVALIDGLSTSQNRAGDQFTATLSAPVVIDGNTVLDKNTKVRGRVTDVEESGRVKGRASIRLVLTDIHYHGADVAISTKPFV